MSAQVDMREELEALTGKIYKGNLTPVVFDLVKESNRLKELYKYLTGDDFDAHNNNTNKPVRKESNNRPSFEKWFSHCERI